MDAVPLTPLHLSLIDALAQRMVADYLAAQPAANQDTAGQRANPVPLPPVDRVA